MVQNGPLSWRRTGRARVLALLLLLAVLAAACGPVAPPPTVAPTIALPALSPTPFPTYHPLARLLELSATQIADARQRTDQVAIDEIAPPLDQPEAAGQPSAEEPARQMPVTGPVASQPEPAPTRTPMPTRGLGSTAGWGLIPSEEGLIAMRSSGAEMVLLTNEPVFYLSVSPNGRMAAYVTHGDPYNDFYTMPLGYTLRLMNLVDGSVRTLARLDPPGVTMDSPLEEIEPAFLAMQAYEQGGLAWSPGSTYLAFVSAQEGRMGEVYGYTVAANQLWRVSNFQGTFTDPAFAYNLLWAPTGRALFYSAAHHFGVSRGNWMAGAFVSNVDGSIVQVAGNELMGESPVNWVSGEELLMTSWNDDCGTQNLRRVHVRSGAVQVLWPGCFGAYRYDRARREFIISIPDHVRYFGEDNPGGLWVVHLWRDQPQRISERGFESLYNGDRQADWYGYDQELGLMGIRRTGEIFPVFTGPPYDWTSPLQIRPVYHRSNDPAWLWRGDTGLYLARPGQELVQVFDRPTEGFYTGSNRPDLFFFYAYSDDGRTNLYTIRSGEWAPHLVNDELPSPRSINWTN